MRLFSFGPGERRRLVLLLLSLSAGLVLADGPGRFRGGPAQGGDPNDLANVVGDQTLLYVGVTRKRPKISTDKAVGRC